VLQPSDDGAEGETEGSQTYEIEVPSNKGPGDVLKITIPGMHEKVSVQVPAGAQPGSTFSFTLPAGQCCYPGQTAGGACPPATSDATADPVLEEDLHRSASGAASGDDSAGLEAALECHGEAPAEVDATLAGLAAPAPSSPPMKLKPPRALGSEEDATLAGLAAPAPSSPPMKFKPPRALGSAILERSRSFDTAASREGQMASAERKRDDWLRERKHSASSKAPPQVHHFDPRDLHVASPTALRSRTSSAEELSPPRAYPVTIDTGITRFDLGNDGTDGAPAASPPNHAMPESATSEGASSPKSHAPSTAGAPAAKRLLSFERHSRRSKEAAGNAPSARPVPPSPPTPRSPAMIEPGVGAARAKALAEVRQAGGLPFQSAASQSSSDALKVVEKRASTAMAIARAREAGIAPDSGVLAALG